ncbi:HAMP domain-containing sensor histidine kinase [Microcoleus sp. FACHB-68]|uniref:sensor histidine kinase n=1 Tax=Microcoleus sp. FACHB-68 TaxID=2692826 RepID=UPI001687E823|nr:HAMP domain-containing sensor histidine kinase [Microcoleus sp. FACHB-68]MBD1937933.1 HAMP domain-containing histidine kinase [Microcoleus sp. FACHB-68]
MMDFSQALLNKIDTIVEIWVETVRQDDRIETAKELTYKGVRDSVPIVLQAIARMLSPSEDNDIKTLVEKSLEHGTLRAKQGYDAEEIAREYRLLRWVIFSTLEEDLIKGSSAEVIRACRLIDTGLDEVIARCFKTYTEERLRELEDLQNQLKLTNQELTRLVRASKDNLSHLAHELKTPLTSIIGYSDLFLRQQEKNPETKDSIPNLGHIDKVLKHGRQLLHLINDALEISRYEAGKMILQPNVINLKEIMANVTEMVEPMARSKNIKISVDYEEFPEPVVTDCLRLQQIVTNLMTNAIRYTESGSVNMKCQMLSDRQWSITVSDTGIGIAQEKQLQIFEPYFREAEAGNQPYVPYSTGLGLAIVTRLVELLQGKIELESNVGVGSKFTVIFPLEIKVSEVQVKP